MLVKLIAIVKSLGLDKESLPTLLLRAWQSAAGAATVLLIPLCFSKTGQGYYYTFASLIAMQVFFDLGMGQIIIQLVSHEFAHINDLDTRFQSDQSWRIKRLAELLNCFKSWYKFAALLFFLFVTAYGFWFLNTKGELPQQHWIGPWILLTLATSINIYQGAQLIVYEGCGMYAQVTRMRLYQSVLGSVVMLVALYLKFDFWAITLTSVTSAFFSTIWLHQNRTALACFKTVRAAQFRDMLLKYLNEIFPFQWRIAISWISGYLIFQLLTPVIFSKFGSVEAGRIGLTIALLNGLSTCGMSWIYSKVPNFSHHVSRKEWFELNKIFKHAATRSVISVALGIFLFLITIRFLKSYQFSFADRFADWSVILCLSVVQLGNSIVSSVALYMRAHKEEPMMNLSLVVGFLTFLSVKYGSEISVFMMVFLYASINIGIALPWSIFLFKKYYKN